MTASQKWWFKELTFVAAMTALIFWFFLFGGAEFTLQILGR
jgi:hypothetical protein